MSQQETTDRIHFLKGTSSSFRFQCKACGRCCGEFRIALSPYDIIRLRRASGLTTTELRKQGFIHITRESFKKVFGFVPLSEMLEAFGVPRNDSVPLATLGFHPASNARAECHFLTPESEGRRLCGIYKDRPTMCRLHPLGFVTVAGRRRWFFRQPFCEAAEAPPHTVVEWIRTSRLAPFLRANARYLRWMRDLLAESEHLASIPEHHWQSLAIILYDFDSLNPSAHGFKLGENSRVSISVLERLFYQWLESLNLAQ
ncbi:MAG: hypothetical protein Kow0099_29060 [Candidatus Abyssubacteria bacterium]